MHFGETKRAKLFKGQEFKEKYFPAPEQTSYNYVFAEL
jgi:hypothetical protein